MEDNEFEEVTIISHTDRPQRVFSEKSIEKLKDQVSLEIVKEINGTEDKTYNDDPRLAPGLRELEKLKQDHFGEGGNKIKPKTDIYFISRVAGESGQYLLGSSKCTLIPSFKRQAPQIIPEEYSHRGYKSIIRVSATQFLGIIYGSNPRLISIVNDGYKIEQLTVPAFREGCAKIVAGHLYLKTDASSMAKIRLDRLLENDFEKIELKAPFWDFFVCPKTETITTLIETHDKRFFLQRIAPFLEVEMFPFSRKSRLYILKKMYSDHFLVGESCFSGEHLFRLVDLKSLRTIDSIGFTEKGFSSLGNIRLLAPRQGINCFLVAMSQSLELFCEYRLKLYHLKTLEISGASNMCVSYQRDGLWMAAGSNSTILSVRVDFSKCPALQL